MSRTYRLAVLMIVVLAVIAVLVWGRAGNRAQDPGRAQGAALPAAQAEAAVNARGPQPGSPLPRLVDLGSTTCIPCKKMAPILEELEREYAGRMTVLFIDINKDRQAAADYGIKLIPTQIFLDGAGRELFRHEGFIGKEDILAKWRELGFDLGAPSAGTAG